MTPLINKELKDAFLFTLGLSNNVRVRPNKYAVLQQIEFSFYRALYSKHQKLLLIFFRNFALLWLLHRLAKV